MLRIEVPGDNPQNSISQHLLLIGFGKHGAEGTIEVWEEQVGASLEGKKIKVNGTLIYHDGKTLLELTKGKRSLDMVFDDPVSSTGYIEEKEVKVLTGEIIDPKCYFGVMKPGFDKPHRSCAARCIAGGIPPVLRVELQSGLAQYYLMYNQKQQHPAEEVQPYIGQRVEVSGKVKKYQDWNILEVDFGVGLKKKENEKLLTHTH